MTVDDAINRIGTKLAFARKGDDVADLIRPVLEALVKSAIQYEAEQGYFSTVAADAEVKAREEERAAFLEIACQIYQAAKDFHPDNPAVIRTAEINFNRVKERAEG